MTADQSNLLQSLFSSDRPLGPASLDDVRKRNEAVALFDEHNEVERVVRRHEPVFLVGRKGSGKTAFLKSAVSKTSIVVELNSPELISQVARTLSALDVERFGVFTERVVPIWNACFTAALCSKLWSHHSNVDRATCPNAFKFGQVNRRISGFANDAAFSLLQAVRRRAESEDYASLTQLVDETELNGVPLWVARRELEAALRRMSERPLISFDSLDQYEGVLTRHGFLPSAPALALQGLFRSASLNGRDSRPLFNIRVSFPGELWHFYYSVSANPLKDFDNTVILHWDNRDLLQICAVRLTKYLRANFPDLHRTLDPSLTPQEVLLRFLPRKITNSMGQEELTIPYLLRHTQLLPRHIIQIFNEILQEIDLRSRSVDEVRVRAAVESAEDKILATVIESFRLIYPYLDEICKLIIPHLEMSFPARILFEQIKRHRKFDLSIPEIMGMLVEVGVVGRVVDETSKYIKGDFEYLHLHRLLVDEHDELCLHPLFGKGYDSPGFRLHSSAPIPHKPIMPLGSDPKSPDENGRYLRIT